MKKQIFAYKKIVKDLKNGDHATMNESIVSRMETYEPQIGNAKLTAHTTAYKAAYTHEDMVMKPFRAAKETPLIHEADLDRSDAMTYIESTVTVAYGYSKLPNEQKAAHVLMPILANYKNIKNKNLTDETGLVTNLLEDLDKPAAKAALATLNIQSVVEDLRTANNTFKSLWDERAQGAEAKRQHGTVKEARAKTDEQLGELTDFIEALYNSNLLPEAMQKLLGEMIDFLNAEITAYIDVLSHRHLKNKPHKPSPGDGGEGGEDGSGNGGGGTGGGGIG
ncbi:MAG: DUF6261 family protein [Tannerellaceae bacterium]|jgi:hypothetical protein|nr:DUF6261 family protein [Tannerellaceae bacterium]